MLTSTEQSPAVGPNTFMGGSALCSQSLVIQQNVTFLKRSVDSLDWLVLPSYLFTCLFGSVGNLFVIYVILRFRCLHRKVTQSVTNDYILNLSFADFLFVLTLPFFLYATVHGDWPFGEATCKLTFAVHETNRFASVYTIAALSVDRYLASFPRNRGPRNLRNQSITRLVCSIIWLVCGLLTTPYFMYAAVEERSDPCGSLTKRPRMCRFQWPKEHVFEYRVNNDKDNKLNQ